MSGAHQAWLVAKREVRERSRSRAFLASLVIMVAAVVAVIALPSFIDASGGTKDVGIVGSTPANLSTAITVQGQAVGIKSRMQRFDDRAEAEHALRDGDIDVLVVDANRLEWQRRADEQLGAVVTAAIQISAVQQRANRAGLDDTQLAELLAPVTVTNVEIGAVAGRSPDDETAAFIMTMLLFMTIATYGAMVLNGVVEEKASRVVEVLLARIPARSLLAGKVAGIGLLGLGQVAVTALAALIAAATFNDIDLPAARGPVLAWALVFFVLGYALYATVFGALGSLASRPEDAQSAVGPVSVLLILVYFVSFAAIGSPDASWARIVSWIPLTAPIAMPSRLAMGSAAWWEPAAACALTVGAIAALVVVGGRVYANAVLHNGPTLKLRDAWQHTTTVEQPILTRSPVDRHRVAIGALIAAVIAGGLVVATSGDAIIGIAAGSVVFALVDRVAGAWGGERRSSHTPTRWRGAHRGRQVEP